MAARAACRVRNIGTNEVHQTLQAAVDAARQGDRLAVRGVCHGGTVIDKDLVIEGVETPNAGRAVLDGEGRTRVLLISDGIRVELRGLIIRHGNARTRESVGRRDCSDRHVSCGRSGGGIQNEGRLTLIDVVVSDNAAGRGGGIHNSGTLTLHGRSRITGNSALTIGGGIFNTGTVVLNGRSGVDGNTQLASYGYGGGISQRGHPQVERSEPSQPKPRRRCGRHQQLRHGHSE